MLVLRPAAAAAAVAVVAAIPQPRTEEEGEEALYTQIGFLLSMLFRHCDIGI